MTYFEDLTLHTYTYRSAEESVVNIGWLGEGRPFTAGTTSAAFRDALGELCVKPIGLHRGFHVCELCPRRASRDRIWARIGNGQIRILGQNGVWYVAPTMIHHYVTEHEYKPPQEFIDAVLNPKRIAESIPDRGSHLGRNSARHQATT